MSSATEVPPAPLADPSAAYLELKKQDDSNYFVCVMIISILVGISFVWLGYGIGGFALEAVGIIIIVAAVIELISGLVSGYYYAGMTTTVLTILMIALIFGFSLMAVLEIFCFKTQRCRVTVHS